MIRALLRWLGRLGVACLALIALLFIFGPYEEVEMPEPFDHDRLIVLKNSVFCKTS